MKKMIQIISVVIIAAGAMMIAGTAGASDLDLIDFGTIVRNSLIGLVIMMGGVFLAWIGGMADGE